MFPGTCTSERNNLIYYSLLTIFSRVGVPREIISDGGPRFTSELMIEIHRLIGIKNYFHNDLSSDDERKARASA